MRHIAEIELAPFRGSQFTRSHECQRGKLECGHRRGLAGVLVQSAQQFTDALRIDNRSSILHLQRRQGTSQIAAHVALSATGCDGIS